MSIFGMGTLTGLALIVAIGAQNAFILRQGLRREHVGAVVALCILSDVLLIFAGTAGIGALVATFPAVLEILRWAGAGYLLWWAVRSFRAAWKPTALQEQTPRSRGSVVLTAAALTYLNPHVYLDTVVLLGSLANQHGVQGRWIFASGAAAGSVLWFTALGFGARALSAVLNRPGVWRVIDICIGVMMAALAAALILGSALLT